MHNYFCERNHYITITCINRNADNARQTGKVGNARRMGKADKRKQNIYVNARQAGNERKVRS